MPGTASGRRALSGDALGALYMTLGSLAYVINDGLVRLATEDGLDVYQVLFLRGCCMVAVLAVMTSVRNESIAVSTLRGAGGRPLVIRILAEVVGTALFFAAVIQLEFANAQTILMLVPFAVTALASRTGESVSTRRYLLVALGFVGVIAVIRPTPDGFSWWSLVVVVAAIALLVREFATRRVRPDIAPTPIALLTAIAITAMMGLLSMLAGWGPVTKRSLVMVGLASLLLIAGYLFSIETVRVGALSVSAPFRYTSVLGAVVVGLLFFDERPDPLTVIGCVLIVGAGVAAALDEHQSRAR